MKPNNRAAFYDEDYFIKGQYVDADGLPFQDTQHLVRYADRLNQFAPAQKVLECGCAVGNLTLGYRLSSPPIEAYGIDISTYAIAHSDGRIRNFLSQCDISDSIPYGDGEFDLVTGFDVLEHIPTYERLVNAISEMTRVASKYVFLRQPMARHPMSADLADEHSFISTLNPLPHSARLALLDRTPNIISRYVEQDLEHPNTNPREFWIRLFEHFGMQEQALPAKFYIFPNILHIHSFNCLLFVK